MAKARSLVGLDVHATKVVAAVLDAETGQLLNVRDERREREGGRVLRGVAFGRCGRRIRPGRPGTGWRAELANRGVECVVAAPSMIPRASGDRVKTDRRDAEHLVRLLLAGKLHAVRVPGDEEEALRDLVRARDSVRTDLMRCRHRLSKLLLRHGIRFDDGAAWTQRHHDWLGTVTLDWPAAQATLLDARGAIDALAHRREQLEREIVAMLPSSPWVVQVGRLRCLRGVDTLTAVGLCAEIGDFERFARAEQLMSYVGLVPSESTTGQQRRLGAITKTGSGHARGCWSKRPGTIAPARASAVRSPTATRTSRRKRSRSPGQRSGDFTAPGHASRLARNAARSSPSPPPANSPASHGRSPESSNHKPTHRLSRRLGRWRPGNARGTRELTMSNPPPGGWPRPILDSGSPTTNHGPAAHQTRVYQSDRASRTACRTATHPADHKPRPTNAKARNCDAPLDKRLSISVRTA